MLIDKNSEAVTESSQTTWHDMLSNAKILLDAIDRAIYELTTTNISEYTLNTGQDSQTVRRADLGTLYSRRKDLINQIATLEARLGIGGCRQVRQILPGF